VTLVEAIKITYESTGHAPSDLALAVMVDDLSAYPLNDVMTALSQIRKNGRKFSFVDVLERLPGAHPGVEEAWAIVGKCLNNEDVSLVWTDQMREAYGAISHMRDDVTGARMAFKEIYTRHVAEARERGEAPQWKPSLSNDPSAREAVLLEAVRKGRLSADFALRLVVQGGDAETIMTRLIGDTKRIG